MQHHRLTCWLLPLAAFAISLPQADPPYYCHEELTWPDISSRDGLDGELTKVLVFTRSGARSPTEAATCWDGDDAVYTCRAATFSSFSADGGSSPSPRFKRVGETFALNGTCLLGQLDSFGLRMQSNNGQLLAKAYSQQLKLGTNPAGRVRIRAEDVSRSIAAAEAVIVGMYPAMGDAIGEVVIPDPSVDGMRANTNLSPGLPAALDKFYSSDAAKKRVRLFQDKREHIGRITGRAEQWKTGDAKNLPKLYRALVDCLYSHVCSTVPAEPRNVPKGLEVGGELWNHVMQEVVYWSNGEYNATHEIAQCVIGPIFGEIMGNIVGDERPFFLYSGHASGPIGPLLSVLGLKWVDTNAECGSVWPPFGAMLVMEIDNNHIRWIYNGRLASADAVPGCAGSQTCFKNDVLNYLATFLASCD